MLEQMATQQGEEVVTSTLAARAVELTQLLESSFPRKTLAEIEAAYKPSGSAPNAALAQLTRLVREHAAVATEHFKQAELWLVLKSPAVSDGNNFGVDVQQYVATELKELRKSFAGMIAGPADWHWARASGLEKVAQVRPALRSGVWGRRPGQQKRWPLARARAPEGAFTFRTLCSHLVFVFTGRVARRRRVDHHRDVPGDQGRRQGRGEDGGENGQKEQLRQEGEGGAAGL